MRWNTVNKRKAYRTEMILQMRRQGYMYNNSAEEIVDKWIDQGLNAFPSGGVVSEALYIARVNVIYYKKNGFS